MGFIEEKLAHLAQVTALEAELTRSELAQQFTSTVRGLRIDGALPRQFRPGAVNYSSGGRLVGWSLRAVTADVIVTFHDGQDAFADVLGTTVIKAGTSETVCAPGAGVSFAEALFAEVSTAGGAIVGAVWIGAAD